MSIPLRVSALPADQLERVRAWGVDDFGNPHVVTVNRDEGGRPLRCCLREAEVGEQVALLAWRPSPVPGPYAEVGPVFVHAERCEAGRGPATPRGSHRRQLFRAYDPQGHQVDNQLVEGAEAEAALSKLLSRSDVSYVHSRNVLTGCYMFQVELDP